jgi:hypothetical protein
VAWDVTNVVKKQKAKGQRVKTGSKKLPVVAVAFLGLVFAAVFLLWQSSPGSDFQRLRGKWFRTDGGYVIEIRDVSNSGHMDAGYFNPQAIKVSKAEAIREGDETRVFIELRDVNYPGSTYTLRYDRERDVLEGVYYQATLQQSFTVRFIRME